MDNLALQHAIEAILFALGEPVETDRLCQALEADRAAVEAACRALAADYVARDAGIRLACLEDSWQLTSHAQWGDLIRGMLARQKPDKLSPAALETLTVVAYFQPVTRVYIDQVRGVDSSHSLALLLDRDLRQPGRPGAAPLVPHHSGLPAVLWPVLSGRPAAAAGAGGGV